MPKSHTKGVYDEDDNSDDDDDDDDDENETSSSILFFSIVFLFDWGCLFNDKVSHQCCQARNKNRHKRQYER